jgi:hypothetical protein
MMRAGTRRVCVRLSAWLPVPRAAPRTCSWLTGTEWECRLALCKCRTRTEALVDIHELYGIRPV